MLIAPQLITLAARQLRRAGSHPDLGVLFRGRLGETGGLPNPFSFVCAPTRHRMPAQGNSNWWGQNCLLGTTHVAFVVQREEKIWCYGVERLGVINMHKRP